ARDLHHLALNRYLQKQEPEGIAWSLERLAVVEARYGNAQQAARLLGAASVARRELDIPRARWDQADWDGAVATTRAALGEDAYAAACSEGCAMTLEQATDLAREQGD